MSNENPPTAKGVKPSPTPAAVPKHGPHMHWVSKLEYTFLSQVPSTLIVLY